MDGPTIKTDNLYSFSPLIKQVFDTVIAVWRLQPEPHFWNYTSLFYSYMFVLLRIINKKMLLCFQND